MTDLQRDIGGLEARMDGHEKRVDRIEQKIDAGFKDIRTHTEAGFGVIHKRLDELYAAENQRKGVTGLVKTVFTGGAFAGAIEAIKTFFGGHHS